MAKLEDRRKATEGIGFVLGDEIEAQFEFERGVVGSFTSRAKLRELIAHWRLELIGTRGAAMLGGAEAVKIHGEYVPVRAEVVGLDGLSAHADYTEILTWLRSFPRPPKLTFITHGEPAAADELRRRITETLGWRCEIPDYLDTAVLQ